MIIFSGFFYILSDSLVPQFTRKWRFCSRWMETVLYSHVLCNIPVLRINCIWIFGWKHRYWSAIIKLHFKLDNFQSGFRPHHSTQTALIKIINDIRFNSDSGIISVLVLLDVSAVFDTVDHNILIERLENWVGLSGMYSNGWTLLSQIAHQDLKNTIN